MSDLIDKQALLDEIENGIKAGNLEEGYERYPNINNMDDIIETIRYADVVQPESKTGRWIRDEFGSRCGACGLYAYRDKFDRPWESPYCPNCGSPMEVEHE